MIKQHEMYSYSMPISAGSYTDAGYRFRKNTFYYNDHYFNELPGE